MSFRDAFTKSKEQLLDYDDNASLYFGGAGLLCLLIPFSLCFFSSLTTALSGSSAVPKLSKSGECLRYCRCSSCINFCDTKRKDARKRLTSPYFLIQFALLLALVLILLRVVVALSTVKEIQAFNPFDILGLGEGAAEKTIKKAYRTLSLKHHPDKNPNDPSSAAKFMMIAKAYQSLTDEVCLYGGRLMLKIIWV